MHATLRTPQGSAYLGAGTSLDLQQLLPANKSYVSYAGSLTTPPCTEGVLWVMMLNPLKMSLQQVRRSGPQTHVCLPAAALFAHTRP